MRTHQACATPVKLLVQYPDRPPKTRQPSIHPHTRTTNLLVQYPDTLEKIKVAEADWCSRGYILNEHIVCV